MAKPLRKMYNVNESKETLRYGSAIFKSTFFRKTPNFYLAKFFEAKGIQLDVNIIQLKENDADIFQSALDRLPLEQITNIASRLGHFDPTITIIRVLR